jgi:hypothetical protein
MCSRDVKQAFTQSGPLQRTVYLRPHKDVLRLSDKSGDWLLHLLIALYGLTEAPSYWWLWFAEYHMRDLGCLRTVLEPCVFYQPKINTASGCSGCIGTIVDDTIDAGDDRFLKLEEHMSNHLLDVKLRTMGLFDFSGCRIEQIRSTTSLSYEAFIQDLEILEPPATFSDLRVARGKLAWISNTRPNVAVSINRLSQVSEKTINCEHVRLHNKIVLHLQSEKIIRVVQNVDSKDTVLFLFTDASFASNADCTMQLGHVIVLWSRRLLVAVILEAKSTKSRRVTRRVLGAELCGVSHGFDRGFMIRHQMTELLGCTIPPFYSPTAYKYFMPSRDFPLFWRNDCTSMLRCCEQPTKPANCTPLLTSLAATTWQIA